MDPPHPCSHSHLEDLPNELILEIVACLLPIRGFFSSPEPEEGRRSENASRTKTLHGITLTSRRLNALASPLLYHSFILPAAGWNLLLFLRTVKERPETAHRLRYVEMQDGHFRGAMGSHTWSVWADLRAWACLLHSQGLNVFDSCVNVLFRLTNNIVELALEGLYSQMHYISTLEFARLRQLSLKRFYLPRYAVQAYPAPLVHTVDLTISAAPVANHSPVSTYICQLYALCGPRDIDPCQQVDPLGIFDVTLDNCDLEQDQIDVLFQRIHSLRQFTCRWRDRTPINLLRLRQALRRFCHSLDYLELDTLESRWQVTLDEDIPTIGNLRDFTVLKHLNVSGLVLWSDNDTVEHPPLASMLPPSLETLAIQVEWDDYVEDSLMTLSQDAPSQLPNLKTIDCLWQPASVEMAPLLTDMFTAVGISLSLSIAEDA